MNYTAFIDDAARYGLHVAQAWADYCGISREQQAAWLQRLRGKQ